MDTLSLGIKIINKLPQSKFKHTSGIPSGDNIIKDNKPNDVIIFSSDLIPKNFRYFSLTETNNPFIWKNEGGDKAELLLLCS